jgi:hypothetical protein
LGTGACRRRSSHVHMHPTCGRDAGKPGLGSRISKELRASLLTPCRHVHRAFMSSSLPSRTQQQKTLLPANHKERLVRSPIPRRREPPKPPRVGTFPPSHTQRPPAASQFATDQFHRGDILPLPLRDEKGDRLQRRHRLHGIECVYCLAVVGYLGGPSSTGKSAGGRRRRVGALVGALFVLLDGGWCCTEGGFTMWCVR